MSLGDVVRNAVIAVFVAALVGVAALVLGLDGPHALAGGGGVLALVLVLLAQRAAEPLPDLLGLDIQTPAGGRQDVERLAWSLVEHRVQVRGTVLARVGRIAAGRLAEHGLDPHRPEDAARAEALLGAAAWDVLRPGRGRPVTPRALAVGLQALERLPPPGPLGLAHPASSAPSDRTSRAD